MTANNSSASPRSATMPRSHEPMPALDGPLPKVRQIQRNIALQLLQISDQVLLICGVPGIGKSVFLYSLAQQPPETLLVHRATANEAMDATSLLAGFGASSQGSAEPLEALYAAARLGARPALLIDDAALLPDGTLAELLTLWQQAQAEGVPFSLVLAAGSDFEQRLDQLGVLQPNQLYAMELQPLSADQTLEYLSLRLAGGESLLEESKLRAIHVRSRGVPARIEQELDKLLGGSGGKGRSKRLQLPGGGRRISLIVIVAVSALALALLVALRYAERQATRPPALIAQQADTRPVARAPRSVPQPPERTDAAATARVPPEANLPVQPVVPAPVAEEAAPVPDSTATQEEPPRAAEEAEPVERVEPVPVEPEEAAANVAPPAPRETQPAAVAATPLRGNAWLRSRNPARFTIQLIAASDPAALEGFVRQHQLEAQAALLTVQRNQRDWHVVVLGDYPNRAAGRAALQRLPQNLREDGAWIRSFGELQQLAGD